MRQAAALLRSRRWTRDAASFIPKGDEPRIVEYATYYITEILRSTEAHERFCHPLRPL